MHVTGRRADGYHLLDSLVGFADFGDRLDLAPGDGLTVSGPFAEGVPTDDTNLVRRALALAGTTRAVTLDKQVPHPAGLGGGSSDAGAVLRALDCDLPDAALMALGADLPVCRLGRAARMRGAGEDVTPVALPPLAAVLLHPGVAVPTGRVFAELARRQNPPMADLPQGADAAGWLAWLRTGRNDMEQTATRLAPQIGEALAALRAAGAALARMSGSGATCFGLWPDAQAARAALPQLRRPGWWVQPCTLS